MLWFFFFFFFKVSSNCFFSWETADLIKSKQNLFTECLSSMASMKVSFLYIIQPNSQHARPLWLFQLELSIDWLIVRPLFCARYHRSTIFHLNSTGAQRGHGHETSPIHPRRPQVCLMWKYYRLRQPGCSRDGAVGQRSSILESF